MSGGPDSVLSGSARFLLAGFPRSDSELRMPDLQSDQDRRTSVGAVKLFGAVQEDPSKV